MNVHWEKAPDYRTSRTMDWLNDACEAKLKKRDRDHGDITYMALMSPASVGFTRRGTSLGRSRYTRRFPVSLLLTTERTTTDDDGGARQIQPYMLLGTKQWLGRFAAVKKYQPTDIRCYPVKQVPASPRVPVRRRTAIRFALIRQVATAFRHQVPAVAAASRDPARQMADQFQCVLRTSAIDLDIRFPTEYEANTLVEYLRSKSEVKSGLAFMYPRGQSPVGS